jgi:serine/threonine protein kinase
MTAAMAELLRKFSEPQDVEVIIGSLADNGTDIDAARRFLDLVLATPLIEHVDSDEFETQRAELLSRLCMKIEATLKERKLGSVYLIRDTYGAKRILKVSFPGNRPLDRSRIEARILNEFNSLEQLRHIGGIVRAQNCELQPIPYLMLDYVCGKKVSDLLDINVARRIALCEHMAEIVAAVHDAGIVHGDIHAGNFLLSDFGRLTMIDFDCSFAPGRSTATRIGGALPFLPPERVFSNWREGVTVPANFASDIYQLGVMFYWLISKTMPYRAATATALAKAITTNVPKELGCAEEGLRVPAHIKSFVDRALSKNPDHRPRSIREYFGSAATEPRNT